MRGCILALPFDKRVPRKLFRILENTVSMAA
jgi:hypothetical protein